MGRKCKKPFRPKTVNMRPSRMRAMRTAIFTSVSPLGGNGCERLGVRVAPMIVD
jgi:hypothetical protein